MRKEQLRETTVTQQDKPKSINKGEGAVNQSQFSTIADCEEEESTSEATKTSRREGHADVDKEEKESMQFALNIVRSPHIGNRTSKKNGKGVEMTQVKTPVKLKGKENISSQPRGNKLQSKPGGPLTNEGGEPKVGQGERLRRPSQRSHIMVQGNVKQVGSIGRSPNSKAVGNRSLDQNRLSSSKSNMEVNPSAWVNLGKEVTLMESYPPRPPNARSTEELLKEPMGTDDRRDSVRDLTLATYRCSWEEDGEVK